MSQTSFWIFYVIVLVVMLAYRCIPLFALKGRELSPKVSEALSLIAPAAFAALVANDLLDPTSEFDIVPLLAALVVILVAIKTNSLIWCALVGMGAYALLVWLI